VPTTTSQSVAVAGEAVVAVVGVVAPAAVVTADSGTVPVIGTVDAPPTAGIVVPVPVPVPVPGVVTTVFDLGVLLEQADVIRTSEMALASNAFAFCNGYPPERLRDHSRNGEIPNRSARTAREVTTATGNSSCLSTARLMRPLIPDEPAVLDLLVS